MSRNDVSYWDKDWQLHYGGMAASMISTTEMILTPRFQTSG